MYRVALLLVLSLSAGHAAASVIVSHQGANDPLSQGWTVVGAGAGVHVDPVVNDLGLGIDAWKVDDNSTVGGSTYQYQHVFGDAERDEYFANEWSLEMDIRMLDNNDAHDFSVFAEVSNGTRRYIVRASTTAAGELRLGLFGPDLAVVGPGLDRYNNVRLDYDPLTETVDLFANGVEVISDWAGTVQLTNNRVAFGSGQSNTQGGAHYASVAYTVPTPASAGFLLMGLIVLLRRKMVLNKP